MKIIVSIFILLLFTNCQDSKHKYNPRNVLPDNTKDSFKKDTLRLVKILSSSSLNNTSILINKDSVFFTTRDPLHDSIYCSVEMLFYNSTGKKFVIRNMSSRMRYEEIQTNLLKSAYPAVYVKSIGNFKIEYAKLPNKLKNEVELKRIISSGMKIQLYNEKYFFIDQLGPKVLYSYDPKTRKVATFDLSWLIMHVTGFFLCDIDKDGNPEVFIFNIGIVPKEDWVSYTIYSIRKDFVAVEYE